jgi:ADP-ribose pyrophosphatase
VLAIPVFEGWVGLVPMYRYPIGKVSLEFPRGGVDDGESPVEAACRELEEEAGLSAVDADAVGTVHAETGLIESGVTVVRVRVDGMNPAAVRNEGMESVAAPVWLDRSQTARAIGEGTITCGLTLAALAMVWVT